MAEAERTALMQQYLNDISAQFASGQAREHSYRPALERLMMSFDKVHAVNEPKHSEHGAPDFVFLSDSNTDLILGYAEAKDVNVSLDKTEKSEQMIRYGGYANLFLTDYLEFRFFRNGEKYETISMGYVKNDQLHLTPENGERLMRELEAFLEQTPEKIKSGKRLARIMGGKARRIRDNVAVNLKKDSEHNTELSRIYEMMKKMLVHDLTEEKFADMYAQTLVYGLFVARYGDKTPDTFSRGEARELVPKSNPFLRHFFDHIAGPDFNNSLGYIVDELCEIFLVSNVNEIVHKHLRIADDTKDVKDPIIHFYEDFLQEYDPAERKRMGAYYTPIPVVQYIVRQVDKILKEDFGIAGGLASDETFTKKVDQGHTAHVRNKETGRLQKTSIVDKTFYRVQVLDPAVGTATFLNETIKHIHKSFVGQEGRWSSYVNDNLLKRLYGFELMMAPYTIAHLKLGMTLQETGVDKINERLSVFLTNTLEEGVPQQSSIFDFGLASAVSEESRLAAEVKSEKPVMVIMGNPPYSGVSSNDTVYANGLVEKYRVEPGGHQKLNEQKQWLKNDYVKFLAFAENMIENNGDGVVAMITDHSYLEGPTFRGMRWRLTQTFDKIYILDLHGNSKKKEKAPNGEKDENVFDIMQGVSIILAVKNREISEQGVWHADLFGPRNDKFKALSENKIKWEKLVLDDEQYFFDNKDIQGKKEYDDGIKITDLFNQKSLGFMTGRDGFATDIEKVILEKRLNQFYSPEISAENAKSIFGIKDFRKFVIEDIKHNFKYDPINIKKFAARPFDNRYVYYQQYVVQEWQNRVMRHLDRGNNVALVIGRQSVAAGGPNWDVLFIADSLIDLNIFRRGGGTAFPLYLNQDGTLAPNFNNNELKKLVTNLGSDPSPESVLDYIYGILHSPEYREKYNEFLKIDFPRVPVPANYAEFKRIVEFGKQLRELHLMKSSPTNNYATTYSETGTDIVESIKYLEGKVWINDNQYFGNVPGIAWNFYIGGYQPAQKWLKDRKGRKLSNADIDHYQKIIKILIETDRIMKEIDSK